jgi:diguanylate cyclase (GGDEF)-like protein/PAS domain S-box-containing protein
MALTTLRTETARFVIVNRSYADMLGYDRAALRGIGPIDVTHPDDRDAMIAPRRELISGRLALHRMEIRLVRADGSVLWASLSRSIVCAADGRPLYLVAHVEDVTERRAAREEMARQAITDPLTGVANRRVVHDHLADVLTVGHPAVIYCDLDDFKAVNDNLGHDAGDRVLREVAARLVTIAGASGTVARVGGDEFVVVLAPAPSPGDVERVLRNIATIDLRVPLGRDTVSIGVTAGVAHRQPGDTAQTLVQRADRAMYSAKAAAAATA